MERYPRRRPPWPFVTVSYGYYLPRGYGAYGEDYAWNARVCCWWPFNIPMRLIRKIYHWSLYPFKSCTWLETQQADRASREIRRLLDEAEFHGYTKARGELMNKE